MASNGTPLGATEHGVKNYLRLIIHLRLIHDKLALWGTAPSRRCGWKARQHEQADHASVSSGQFTSALLDRQQNYDHEMKFVKLQQTELLDALGRMVKGPPLPVMALPS